MAELDRFVLQEYCTVHDTVLGSFVALILPSFLIRRANLVSSTHFSTISRVRLHTNHGPCHSTMLFSLFYLPS
jgi:hypothetical protein